MPTEMPKGAPIATAKTARKVQAFTRSVPKSLRGVFSFVHQLAFDAATTAAMVTPNVATRDASRNKPESKARGTTPRPDTAISIISVEKPERVACGYSETRAACGRVAHWRATRETDREGQDSDRKVRS